jgi:hypothetical protein
MKIKLSNYLSLLLGLILLTAFNFACDISQAKTENPPQVSGKKEFLTKRIDNYNRLGIEFVYYKIAANLSREDLIAVAQQLHETEPNASLVLVDDESKVNEYMEFAKLVNPGYNDVEMPKEWADKHIIANLQRYLSGKFVLCEGYGYKEIAKLK